MTRIIHVSIVTVIVATFALVASCFGDQDRSLHEAVRKGDLTLVKKLLDDRCRRKRRSGKPSHPPFILPKIQTLLTYCWLTSQNWTCAALLPREPPLEHAAERFSNDKIKTENWRAIVSKLRHAGGEYTIDAAIFMDDVTFIASQLEKDDSWVNKSPSVPLRIAAGEGRESICKLLIKHKADPNDFERGMGFPIMINAIDHPAIVKLLIDAGANFRRRITWKAGRSGFWIIQDEATALHFAAEAGNVESCRLLVKAGLDINAADNEGTNTSSHCVASRAVPRKLRVCSR